MKYRRGLGYSCCHLYELNGCAVVIDDLLNGRLPELEVSLSLGSLKKAGLIT